MTSYRPTQRISFSYHQRIRSFSSFWLCRIFFIINLLSNHKKPIWNI